MEDKIGKSDGPTSVLVLKKNAKLTLKQKFQKMKYDFKKIQVEKRLLAKSHTIDEVMNYIVNNHGFIEADLNSEEVLEEYREMRASFLIRYAPELLGEYAEISPLKSTEDKDVMDFLEKSRQRIQKAKEIPTTEFDIDFHKFIKNMDDSDDEMHIIIEKKYAYIGGGFSGSKKLIKKFGRIQKDIFRYYGVTQEDIATKSDRYRDVVRALSR